MSGIDTSKAADVARAREKLRVGTTDREPLAPHPDHQAEEGGRRARMSRGVDWLPKRMEMLEVAEELGWPKMSYGKPQLLNGVSLPGKVIKPTEESWEQFAKHAHFSVLAPVLRNARVLRDYKRGYTGMDLLDLRLKNEVASQNPDPYPQLTKARAVRAANREAQRAGLHLQTPNPA